MIDYDLILKEIENDNSCSNIYSLINTQCDDLKGKFNIDLFFHKLESSLSDEQTINRFYAVAFIVSYYQKRKFKATAFRNSYLKINQQPIDENITDFLCHTIKKTDISFLNYCKKFEEFPWFLRINTNKLISTLILDSFFIQYEKSLIKKIELINCIKKDDFIMDIDYINNRLKFKEIKQIKFWQIKYNPYLSNSELVVKLSINNKTVFANLKNATIWSYMKKVSEYLIRPFKKNYVFYYLGLDNMEHNKLMPFLESFLSNSFIKKYMGQYLIQKTQKAEINKDEWRFCLITLALDTKENTRTIKQNKI